MVHYGVGQVGPIVICLPPYLLCPKLGLLVQGNVMEDPMLVDHTLCEP